MKIVLDFDPMYVEQRMSQHRPPIFVIALEHDGEYYPERTWTDFGSVVIQMWMNSVGGFCQGRHDAEFLFMDGPYSLSLQRVDYSGYVKVTSSNPHTEWVVSLESICSVIIDAATTIANKLNEIQGGNGYSPGILETLGKFRNMCSGNIPSRT